MVRGGRWSRRRRRASAWLKPVHPGLRSPENVVVYVLNVFVDPGHRSRGIARALMVAITDWARAAGHHVVELHASDQGRPLYESLGFAATNEMRLFLR